jgi:hypothetical protein
MVLPLIGETPPFMHGGREVDLCQPPDQDCDMPVAYYGWQASPC